MALHQLIGRSAAGAIGEDEIARTHYYLKARGVSIYFI